MFLCLRVSLWPIIIYCIPWHIYSCSSKIIQIRDAKVQRWMCVYVCVRLVVTVSIASLDDTLMWVLRCKARLPVKSVHKHITSSLISPSLSWCLIKNQVPSAAEQVPDFICLSILCQRVMERECAHTCTQLLPCTVFVCKDARCSVLMSEHPHSFIDISLKFMFDDTYWMI